MNICNIETDITDHCNLTCANCSHHSPYVSKGFYSIDQFEIDIQSASKFLHCNWFKILGGEPLLNSKLSQYIECLRKHAICDNIAIFTNGILLDKVRPEVLSSVDCVVVSRYPGKQSYENKVRSNIKYSREHVKTIHNYYDTFESQEFITKNDDPKLVKLIFDRCKLRYECNAIYKGYFYKCMACQRKKEFLSKHNIEPGLLDDVGIDGVKINSPTFHADLLNYYYSDKPLHACSYCTGSSGKDVKHHNKLTQPGNTIQDVICENKLKQPPIHATEEYKHLMTCITRDRENVSNRFVDNDGIEHNIPI